MEDPNQETKSSINSEDHPIRRADYRLEQLDDELLLYHPSETKILYLNQSASLVWGLCDGEHSVAEIVQLLNRAYPEAAASIPDDVHAALVEFLQAGCIELRSGKQA
jgi:hypothetical protein